MEILREFGLQDAVNAVAVDMSGGTLGKVSATTLATADLSNMPSVAPTRIGWADQLSPATIRGTCPQHRLDSMLRAARGPHSASVRTARCWCDPTSSSAGGRPV